VAEQRHNPAGSDLLAGAAFGQGHEFGVIGGYGFTPTLTLSGAAGNAPAGFRNGGAVGVRETTLTK
jgi:hypothetical protein